MKLAGFVILGIVVTFVVYFTIGFWIIDNWLPDYSGGGGSSMGVAFLVILPLSLLLGSILTGFLSYSALDSRLGLLGIAPGLYIWLLSTVSCVLMGFGMFLYGFCLYLVSLAGVGSGYSLRALFKRRSREDPVEF